ncbi:mitoguardin, partial [Caerostris extrusa]
EPLSACLLWESFVSAQAEVADLAEFEEYECHVDLKELALYQTALKKNEEGAIPIRLLRTEITWCQSNREYIAKVHCIRWLSGSKDCLLAYEDIIAYSKIKRTGQLWRMNCEVKCLSFYDVVLDFIVLDAFEDLENPPSSVTAVVQNRWLSSGFKETALSTAVWSVLQAKRRMLQEKYFAFQYPNGFISHFYKLSEHLIPVLAWGFYGPNETLKEICVYFKDEVMSFMFDIFNFNKVRFTKIEELASDIMQLANIRFDKTIERLSM